MNDSSPNQNSLLPALVETIKQAGESVAEATDTIAAIATDSEVLDQVPLISTAVKILTVRDIFYRKRLEKNCKEFLEALRNSDKEKITSLLDSISSDENASDDFSDTLLAILSESLKPIKCRILGNLLVSLSSGNIDLDVFQKLSQVIHSMSIPALLEFEIFVRENESFDASNPYVKNGLAATNYLLLSTGLAFTVGTRLSLSELGQELYLHGIKSAQKT